jgi:hypothetical protein
MAGGKPKRLNILSVAVAAAATVQAMAAHGVIAAEPEPGSGAVIRINNFKADVTGSMFVPAKISLGSDAVNAIAPGAGSADRFGEGGTLVRQFMADADRQREASAASASAAPDAGAGAAGAELLPARESAEGQPPPEFAAVQITSDDPAPAAGQSFISAATIEQEQQATAAAGDGPLLPAGAMAGIFSNGWRVSFGTPAPAAPPTESFGQTLIASTVSTRLQMLPITGAGEAPAAGATPKVEAGASASTSGAAKPVSQMIVRRDEEGILVVTAVIGEGPDASAAAAARQTQAGRTVGREGPFSLASVLGSSGAGDSGAEDGAAAGRPVSADESTRQAAEGLARQSAEAIADLSAANGLSLGAGPTSPGFARGDAGDSNGTTFLAAALADATASAASSPSSESPDDPAMAADASNVSVATLSDEGTSFIGAGGGGGGGGGGGPISTYFTPPPVTRASRVMVGTGGWNWGGYGITAVTANRASRQNAATAAAAQANPTGGLPLGANGPSATFTATTSAVTAASTPAPVYVSLPAASGVASGTSPASADLPPANGIAPLPRPYPFRSLQPLATSWVASQVSSINGNMISGFVQDATGNAAHAAAWAGSNAALIDLHPASGLYANSHVLANHANQFVGFGYWGNGAVKGDHALLWTSANAASAVDLNPAGWRSSYAEAITPTQQEVGYGLIGTSDASALPHAAVWSGNAASVIDLNPGGYLYSLAFDGDGTYEVGYGMTTKYEQHALLWQGVSNNAKDLHPTSGKFVDSRAVTLSGGKAGGFGTDVNTLYQHAILWNALDGNSTVDLNPVGFEDSQIIAMNTVQSLLLGRTVAIEVGFGRLSNDVSGNTHALLWIGTEGYLDLNQFLPSKYVSAEADAIDDKGNVVGWAKDGVTGYYNAVEWLAPVPEPATGLAAGMAGLYAITLRRGQRGRRGSSS